MEGNLIAVSDEDPVIRKLIALGDEYDSIRAIVMTSTRCDPNAVLDPFSDYDIEIFTQDPDWLGERGEWLESFGEVLVAERLRQDWGEPQYRGWSRLIVFQDGSKIDFQVNHLHHLKEFASSLPDEYDIGYTVLLDKDGLAAALAPPTFRAFIPAKPSEAEYHMVINGFWWDSTYVTKYLWRDDLMGAMLMHHGLIQDALRTMLEWSVEIQRGWNWRPGHFGRGIKKALDYDTYQELAACYPGGDTEERWEAFSRTTALFRRTAVSVGQALGYRYLDDLDRRVMTYHRAVRKLDRSATSREDLVRLLEECSREDAAGGAETAESVGLR